MSFPSSRRKLLEKSAVAIFITLILLFFPVFAFGDGVIKGKADKSNNREKMLIFNSSDSGKSLALRVGGTFTLSLEENPTTGFQWAVDSIGGDLVQLESSEYIPSTGSGVGRGGQKILTFKAQRPGSGLLQVKLWREWEGDSSIVQKFTLNLQVQD